MKKRYVQSHIIEAHPERRPLGEPAYVTMREYGISGGCAFSPDEARAFAAALNAAADEAEVKPS